MLISIIIPIYNVEKYLRKCLDSVVKQNYEDLEIILIDDGSTDNSGKICDEYSEIDNRIIVLHQNNQGVSSARNAGLEIARGIYIAWIDSDDYISENWLEKVLPFLNGENDIIFYDYSTDKDGKITRETYADKSNYVDKEKFIFDLVADEKLKSFLWQKIIKKELYRDIRFDTKIRCLEDYAELHKIVLKSNVIYYLRSNLYFYRIRANSLCTTVDFDKIYQAYLIALDRYEYLKKITTNINKIGTWIQCLCVIRSVAMLGDLSSKQREEYKLCKKQIDKDILNIVSNDNITCYTKVKLILCYLGMYEIICRLKYRKE